MANSKKSKRTKDEVGTALEAAKKTVEDLQSELEAIEAESYVGRKFERGGAVFVVEAFKEEITSADPYMPKQVFFGVMSQTTMVDAADVLKNWKELK